MISLDLCDRRRPSGCRLKIQNLSFAKLTDSVWAENSFKSIYVNLNLEPTGRSRPIRESCQQPGYSRPKNRRSERRRGRRDCHPPVTASLFSSVCQTTETSVQKRSFHSSIKINAAVMKVCRLVFWYSPKDKSLKVYDFIDLKVVSWAEATPPHVLTWVWWWGWINLPSWHFFARYPLTLRLTTSRKTAIGKRHLGSTWHRHGYRAADEWCQHRFPWQPSPQR